MVGMPRVPMVSIQSIFDMVPNGDESIGMV